MQTFESEFMKFMDVNEPYNGKEPGNRSKHGIKEDINIQASDTFLDNQVERLCKYVSFRKNGQKIADLSRTEFDNLLCSYFIELKKPGTNDKYAKGTLNAIRTVLSKYLLLVNQMNILVDEEFKGFREVFQELQRNAEIQREGSEHQSSRDYVHKLFETKMDPEEQRAFKSPQMKLYAGRFLEFIESEGVADIIGTFTRKRMNSLLCSYVEQLTSLGERNYAQSTLCIVKTVVGKFIHLRYKMDIFIEPEFEEFRKKYKTLMVKGEKRKRKSLCNNPQKENTQEQKPTKRPAISAEPEHCTDYFVCPVSDSISEQRDIHVLVIPDGANEYLTCAQFGTVPFLTSYARMYLMRGDKRVRIQMM